MLSRDIWVGGGWLWFRLGIISRSGTVAAPVCPAPAAESPQGGLVSPLPPDSALAVPCFSPSLGDVKWVPTRGLGWQCWVGVLPSVPQQSGFPPAHPCADQSHPNRCFGCLMLGRAEGPGGVGGNGASLRHAFCFRSFISWRNLFYFCSTEILRRWMPNHSHPRTCKGEERVCMYLFFIF